VATEKKREGQRLTKSAEGREGDRRGGKGREMRERRERTPDDDQPKRVMLSNNHAIARASGH
jgi:hypothetical protein